MSSATHSVDELWLRTLERIAARAAHEIKGALNGVAVNLEVVRSRSAKPDAPASAVASFAAVAAGQLEAVVDMTEAMLVLGRAPREPTDVVATMHRLAALLRPAARAEGHALEIVDPGAAGALPEEGAWSHGNAVRLAVASAVLAGMERKCDVRCRVRREEGRGLSVEIACAGSESGALAMEPEVVDAVSKAGVRVEVTSQGISLAFPPLGEQTRERA